MRFLSIVKSNEQQGAPPQALLDAMAKLTEESIRNGSLVQTGGLGPSATSVRVRIAGRHWPEGEGECELRELVFLAPDQG
jgi:hypothetical protein